ncbi:GNAT family N-acetyltransferase [Paenibacillus sp. VCA1]|uniref:GNAT family N-acetyltransferase n=1 Tax=Paenibacillus sp. VCA1 TaxID=3039148 RepID=UPI0028728DA5|nr:GNAT family N-acetyltransferase [Paenibacillus sp. VCA1]MDR9856260.1 GNAT family N-acetyltransferase [Paenibacillus sp. VCA1]
MFPELETERLILREITKEDTESIFACFSNGEAMRYYGQDAFEHREQAERLIGFFADSYREKRGIRWGIERKDAPGLIGTVGFNAWSPKHRRAEIGYEIHPDHWRKGYASEAVACILAYGFEALSLARIGAVVYTENAASSRMLIKLGFREEGLLRHYMFQSGVSHDTYAYSLLPGDRGLA